MEYHLEIGEKTMMMWKYMGILYEKVIEYDLDRFDHLISNTWA